MEPVDLLEMGTDEKEWEGECPRGWLGQLGGWWCQLLNVNTKGRMVCVCDEISSRGVAGRDMMS